MVTAAVWLPDPRHWLLAMPWAFCCGTKAFAPRMYFFGVLTFSQGMRSHSKLYFTVLSTRSISSACASLLELGAGFQEDREFLELV